MPNLFGDPGRPVSVGYTLRSVAKACVSREFRAFAARASSPVSDWLRALAAHAHPLCGGRGVGAIGMCFTGNFALSMMLEPAMLAPVLSQPSRPTSCGR
jgi:dienelactone hydrolase